MNTGISQQPIIRSFKHKTHSKKRNAGCARSRLISEPPHAKSITTTDQDRIHEHSCLFSPNQFKRNKGRRMKKKKKKIEKK